jgi:hypothetical protein
LLFPLIARIDMSLFFKRLFKFSFSTEIYQCLAVGEATQPRRQGILFLYNLKNHGKNPFLNSFSGILRGKSNTCLPGKSFNRWL